ncbi:MAG: NAD(P)H-dependent oxidoreductase [Saprospiraceae bacterium]|nr:NAD(P)H-dependent oxidoreductase [Saprospiraceae bacterium]
MITVISGTNRNLNQTLVLAEHVRETIEKEGHDVRLLDLRILEAPLLVTGDYESGDQSSQVKTLQDDLILPADKFYFVVPEYNGSFPGILKFFLDACSVRDIKESFTGKKAAILGVSTGRAGNLRGMDHLAGILNYLDITVMPNRLPVSQVSRLIEAQQLEDAHTRAVVHSHVLDFLQF